MNIKSINLEPVAMPGEGQYNLNNLKEIKVKESFFELPQYYILNEAVAKWQTVPNIDDSRLEEK